MSQSFNVELLNPELTEIINSCYRFHEQLHDRAQILENEESKKYRFNRDENVKTLKESVDVFFNKISELQKDFREGRINSFSLFQQASDGIVASLENLWQPMSLLGSRVLACSEAYSVVREEIEIKARRIKEKFSRQMRVERFEGGSSQLVPEVQELKQLFECFQQDQREMIKRLDERISGIEEKVRSLESNVSYILPKINMEKRTEATAEDSIFTRMEVAIERRVQPLLEMIEALEKQQSAFQLREASTASPVRVQAGGRSLIDEEHEQIERDRREAYQMSNMALFGNGTSFVPEAPPVSSVAIVELPPAGEGDVKFG